MGYYSRVTGEVTFSPPLQRQDAPEKWVDRDWQDGWLHLTASDEEVGSLDTISITSDESGKAYHLTEELEDVIAAVNAVIHTTFSGELRVRGEEGDVQRLIVHAEGEVEEWTARLLWPDGSTEPIR